ncbi:bestrophin family ion channel [Pseudenhygromyxa sp. WMMC2535]|uniref:bestrophin family protein n=1 Tax=Pseudenhygromyxa sp. WMMC2535 TaxID=2712867 RepID=UPI001C3C6C38
MGAHGQRLAQLHAPLLTLIGPRMIDAQGDHELAAEEREQVEAVRGELVHALIAYVHAFRHHLRDEDSLDELRGLIPDELRASLIDEYNRPWRSSSGWAHRLRWLYDRGWVHPMHLPALEDSLTEMTSVQGACERIKSTPIPASYTVLIHRIVLLYCVGLPFGIVDQVGAWTPVVVGLVAYAFYGLDSVGTEIENPFGKDPNDLPLTTLSRMIEVNLRQRLGEDRSALPELLEPDDGFFSSRCA